jgi:hypothetical protein
MRSRGLAGDALAGAEKSAPLYLAAPVNWKNGAGARPCGPKWANPKGQPFSDISRVAAGQGATFASVNATAEAVVVRECGKLPNSLYQLATFRRKNDVVEIRAANAPT